MTEQRKTPGTLVAAILAFCSLAQITSSTNSVVQKMIEAFPDVPVSTVRLVSTLPSLSGFIFTLLVGMFLGKQLKYRTNVLLGCLLMGTGGMMPIVFDSSIIMILAARFIAGAGMGCISCYNTIVIACFDQVSRDRMLGIAGMMGSVGSMIWTQTAGILGDIKWQYAYFVYGAAFLVLLIELFCFKEPKRETEAQTGTTKPQGSEIGEKNNILTGKLVFYILTYGVMSLCAFPLCIGMSTFLENKDFGTAALTGTILAVYTVGGALGGLLYNVVLKLCRRFTLPVCSGMVALGYILILLGENVALVGVGTLLCGMGFFMTIPLFMSYVSYELPSSRIPLGVSLTSAGGQIGLFLAGYWMSAAYVLCGGIYATDVECSFFAGIIIFAVIAAITVVKDPRPASMKN